MGVTWVNVMNATVVGAVLEKTSGWDRFDDAGATSQQELSAGDGFVEFTVGEADTFWVGGLSHGNQDTSYGDVDFAFRFNGDGWADVLENGEYRSGGDTPYAAGDVFRVAVVGGRVQYFRNGRFLVESAGSPSYPLILDVALGTLGATVHDARLGISPPPPLGGGFIETAGSPALRPRLTRAQIEAFLPAGGGTGPFVFPAPYQTGGVRLTSASDCAEGQDCLWYAGYSYWRNINNHVGSAHMYIFLGTAREHGGVGPLLVRYNKLTDAVEPLGPLFDAVDPHSFSTGEGWYFSATRPTRLYTFVVGSTELRRYDILLRQFEAMAAMDLTECPRPNICPKGAAFITQPHSSDDDRVHSATVQDGDWQRIGCVVYDSEVRRFRYFGAPKGYSLDECHVDKSGRWLILLETRADGSRRNRVVNLLHRGRVATIEDVDGALGHLDMGFGYAVGADTFNPLPNATILLTFPLTTTARPIGPVVHFNKRWDVAAANHVAHGNAQPGIAPESQYACGSNASRVPDMADEIVCVPLDFAHNANGSLDVLVVAPVMTDLDAAGGRDVDGDDYEQVPKGNLDVTGRYFFWTTNLGGDRLDAFLVKIPAGRFGP
ncbi:MAG: hypothetical protein A3I61_16465 [Acidobacteria bacterium RIFCSPLOWO2_02_FULL_68_18]|nr:MAG: hypothetical protein A3I61_16465 [Acidobacteria bacterium RIFCSPLOWO2_02_FULL_68_18]OFW48601.1 MAG: hypothetical protein A3G77_13905 [Acidobacteria bacterium RIFCSPLOWO2_12_FULL_68_19]